jgi:hypothetical protein
MVYGSVDKTWEWYDEYRLRSTLFPAYLSVPLATLKFLGLDFPMAVRLCPQMAHIFLVIISDRILWRIGKQTVGKDASRIGFLFMILCR